MFPYIMYDMMLSRGVWKKKLKIKKNQKNIGVRFPGIESLLFNSGCKHQWNFKQASPVENFFSSQVLPFHKN